MELSLVLVAMLAFLGAYIGQHLVKFINYTKKAMKLPTNKPNPIFGHTFAFMGQRKEMLQKAIDLLKENEPMFTIWMGPLPYLMLTKPEQVEVVLGSLKNINKKFPYKFLKSWLGSGLLIASGSKWHSHRRLITPAFHFSILEKFLDVFSEKSEGLVSKLQKEVGSEKFDISHYIKLCTLEIILETAMGIKINREDNKQHAEYADACCNITIELLHRVKSPWLFPEILFSLSPSGKRFKKYLQTLHSFTDKVIRERKQQFNSRRETSFISENDIGRKKKLSFLDLLLETTKSGKFLTDEDMRDEVETFMFAGHDTTTAGLCWCLQMLASHPKVQDRAYEELEIIFHDSNRFPTMRDLNEMKYLERVIKETLRMFPSVPTIGREIEEDLVIDGHIVPAGITVGICIIAIHYNPEIYPDPKNFNPDNFLPERIAARHPYSYVPFSAGPRNCIGQKFALLEMKIMLSFILRHYKLEATGEIPIAIPEIILRPNNGIQVKITPRVSSV